MYITNFELNSLVCCVIQQFYAHQQLQSRKAFSEFGQPFRLASFGLWVELVWVLACCVFNGKLFRLCAYDLSTSRPLRPSMFKVPKNTAAQFSEKLKHCGVLTPTFWKESWPYTKVTDTNQAGSLSTAVGCPLSSHVYQPVDRWHVLWSTAG